MCIIWCDAGDVGDAGDSGIADLPHANSLLSDVELHFVFPMPVINFPISLYHHINRAFSYPYSRNSINFAIQRISSVYFSIIAARSSFHLFSLTPIHKYFRGKLEDVAFIVVSDIYLPLESNSHLLPLFFIWYYCAH